MLAVINPDAFFIGEFAVRWYGLIVALAINVGIWLALREARRYGIERQALLDILLWSVISGIVGARLYDVLLRWHQIEGLGEVFAIRSGGMAIHGGILAGCFVGGLLAYKKQFSVCKCLDIAAPGIIMAQAIGRWGNFINQEAYGWPVEREELFWIPNWLMEQMKIKGVYYQPLFLYESLWSLAGFTLLWLVRKRQWLAGNLFAFYVIWYSLGRFYIEGFRANDAALLQEPLWLIKVLRFIWLPWSNSQFNVYWAQLMSLVLILAAALFIYVNRWFAQKQSR